MTRIHTVSNTDVKIIYTITYIVFKNVYVVVFTFMYVYVCVCMYVCMQVQYTVYVYSTECRIVKVLVR